MFILSPTKFNPLNHEYINSLCTNILKVKILKTTFNSLIQSTTTFLEILELFENL